MKNDLTLLLEAPGGGAAEGGESPGNEEGKTASFLTGSGFLKRMESERAGDGPAVRNAKEN